MSRLRVARRARGLAAGMTAGLILTTGSSWADPSLTVEVTGSEVVAGRLFTRSGSPTVHLRGTNQLPAVVRVTVNGRDAAYDPGTGVWNLAWSLAPGYQRLRVRGWDARGVPGGEAVAVVIHGVSTRQVGGPVGSQAIWGPDDGVVEVTNTVTVAAGGMLTVQAGTVVLVAPGAGIMAAGGRIELRGRADRPIFLGPLDGASEWGALTVSGSGGRLECAHVEMAGGRLEVLEGAVGAIADCRVRDHVTVGVPILLAVRPAGLRVQRTHFLRYYEILCRVGVFELEDLLCEEISGDGIDFDGAAPGSFIRGCTVRNGRSANVDAIDLGSYADGTPSRGVMIADCHLSDMPFDKGVSIGERAQAIMVSNCVVVATQSGVAVKDASQAALVQSTFVRCDYGVHLYEKTAGQGGGSATLTNAIAWSVGTNILADAGSSISVGYCDLPGSPVVPGLGNLAVDPRFVDPAAGDYRLSPDSPCRSAGVGGSAMGAVGPVGSSLVDSDGDGMPDVWELERGLDPWLFADGGLDGDGDGMKSWEEYVAGTEPRDAGSVLHFVGWERVGTGVRWVVWAGAGRRLAIERGRDPGGPWERVAELDATSGGEIAWTDDASPAASALCYRVRVITGFWW